MEERKKRVHRETITQVYENRMGDQRLVQQTTNQTYLLDKEPDFVKLYITDIMKLSNLPKSCNSVLMELLKRATYTNEIVVIKSIREEICKTLGIADITLRKAIDEFLDKGILTKKMKGVYVANPFLFARGSWENIRKIRLMVEYNEHGRFLIKDESSDQQVLDFKDMEKPAISGIKFDNDKFDGIGSKIYYID